MPAIRVLLVDDHKLFRAGIRSLLQTISDINPLKHVVSGAREFFLGGYGTPAAWWGAALTLALAVLGWWFGVRRFRRESS